MPLGLERLRITLLVKLKEVDKMLESIKSSWPSSRLIIVFNGWLDATCHPPLHGVFLEWTSVVERSGFSWKIQVCTIYLRVVY